MNSALACGFTIQDWQDLEIGQIIDVIITRINALSTDKKKEKGTRIATQADWDRF